ncbi:hypothetical protein J7J90_03945 [Candidatus Micrarchaeota archaeon]|nr:hypothetical protein [Candidatus Micrarchaeota archaeon]
MMENNKLLIWTFGIIFLLGVAWADVTVSYQILPSSELPPGSNGMAEVTLTNVGSDTVSLSLYSQGSSRIKTDQSVSVGRLKSGASTIVNIPFQIDNNLSSGVYTLYLHLSGEELLSSNEKDEERYISRWVNIPITVKKPVTISAQVEPTVFETGSEISVNMTFVNNGEKVNDAYLIVNGTYVKLSGQSNYYIGDLSGTKTVNVVLSVSDDAASGRTEFPLYLTYTNSLGESETTLFNLPVLIKERRPNFLILMNDSKLLPNTKNELYFSIKNNGEHLAKDVTLSFSDNTVLIPLSESAVSIGALQPGEIKTVRISVATKDVDLGYYTIPITISYNDENNKEMTPETSNVGVYISSPPAINVYVTTSPLPVESGKVHTFSVQATNVGVSDVKALKVMVHSNDVFNVLDPESEQFIGSLDADDFSTVQYKIKVGRVASGQYPLKFTISYLDMANTPHQVEVTKNINVYESESSFTDAIVGNQSFICVVFIVIGLVGMVAYFVFFKNKKVSKQ